MADNRYIFGWPDRADTATFSGGNWQLPLSNAQSPFLSQVARSADTSLASTQFVVNFGQPRFIDTMAIVKHNFSLQALVRWQLFTDAGLTSQMWDSQWQQAWPSIFNTYDLEWEDDNWWFGQVLPQQMPSIPPLSVCLAPAPEPALCALVSINDVNNAATYLQFGKICMCKGYRTQLNMDYGATLTINDPSIIDTAQDGTELPERRSKYREWAFKLGSMSLTEGNLLMSMLLDRGVTNGFLFIEDPTDAPGMLLRSAYVRFKELAALEKAKLNQLGYTHKIKELV